MRVVTLPWDEIVIAFAVDDGTKGVDGLAPTMRVRRIRDGLYLQTDGTWDAVADDLAVDEVDDTGMPGVYVGQIPAESVAPLDDVAGYLVSFVADDSGTEYRDRVHVVPEVAGRMQAGTVRTVYTTHAGDLPAEGAIHLYPDSAARDADTDGTGAAGTVPLAWDYDPAGRLRSVVQG